MQGLTYLLVLGGCLLATLPLEIFLKAGVYRRWPRMLMAVLPVSAGFLIWDYLAVHAGWWWFDENYLTGLFVGSLPIEEILFFLVVPVCGLLTYEGVRFFRPDWARPDTRSQVVDKAEASTAPPVGH